MAAIDILIRAIWQGGAATGKAQREIQNLGNTVSKAGIEFAATQARSRLLQGEMGKLANEVALGNLTVGEARTRYNQFAGSLATFEDTAQKTGLTTAQLVSRIGALTVALGTATIAAKKGFDAIERGAGLELTAIRFDNLARSIGTTGDALRTDLLQATEGMLSSAQAMGLATDLIGLGLANTSDVAVRLGRIVTELDADIGELTLALANQTTRRFDQLGISLQGFNERLNALKGTMSDEQAFTMAFLEQAEAQIERVGGASQTTAGDIRRVQADIAALREELDQELASEAAPFLADLVGRTADNLREQTTAAVETSESVDDLAKAYENLAEQADELRARDPIAFALFNADAVDEAAAEIATAIAQVSTDAEDYQRNLQRVFGDRFFIEELDLQVASLGEVERAYEQLSKPLDEHEQAMIRNDEAMRAVGEGMDVVTEKSGEISEALENLIGQWEANERGADDFSRRLEQLNRGVGLGVGFAESTSPSEQLDLDNELLQDRADLFEGFQESMTAVTEREEAQRLQITEQHEARRTDIIENFNRQRAQEEEDFQRARQRQEEQLARDIAGVQEDTSERQAQLRDDANRRIAELEEEHLKRITDITRDADLQLQEAAGRLDATAVHQIAQQRDRALEEETDRYEEQREDILEELDRRLQLEQEAAEERIRELNEFHDRRQAQEDADRAIRLQREQEAHDRQLSELDDAHDARLAQLQTAAQDELSALGQKYEDEHELLTASGAALLALQQEQQDELLAAEEAWWNERLGLISGASGGAQGLGGTTGASGGGQGFPGSAPYVGATGGSASLSIGEINVNTSPGQDAEEVGSEVVRQIDRYMINLMAGGP